MSGLRALLYLDGCRLRNTVRDIFSKPGRIALWCVFLAVVVGPQLLRRWSGAPAPAISVREPFSTMIGGAVLLYFAWRVFDAARSGKLAGAGAPVEAYLLARSHIPGPLAFAWLRIRAAILALAVAMFVLAYVTIVFAGKNTMSMVASYIGVFVLADMLGIPAFFVARRSKAIAIGAAIALGVFGLASILAEGFWVLHPSRALAALLFHLNVGSIVHQLSVGSPLPLILLYGASLACVAIGAVCARDIYPELYGSSLARAEFLRRARTWRWGFPVSNRASKSGSESPLRGPYAEIWKQLAYVRRANGTTMVSVGIASAILVGAIGAVVIRTNDVLGYTTLGMALSFCLLFLAFRGVSLASDLSKPLWWLGDGSLFEKLVGWTIGTSLLATVLLTLFVLTVGIGVGSVAVSGIGLVCVLVLPSAMRAIGVFVYALTPSMIDQRGPGAALRLVLIYVAFIPAVAVALVVMLALQQVVLGFFAVFAVFALEGVFALSLAARRIEGRGVEFARAEAA